MKYLTDLRLWFAALLVVVIFASLPGCVSYSKVERGDCKAMARGNYFVGQVPGALELCGEDR